MREINNSSEPFDFDADEFENYLSSIIHEWLKTLTILAFLLVPTFLILDYFIMPKELLQRFVIYRAVSTLIVIIQYAIIRQTKASKLSFIHGYVVSVNVGGMIALMTVDLGGFDSSYYAGLNLVIMGVNLWMPWKALHSAVNSIIIISMYIFFNVIAGHDYGHSILINNLFFLFSTAIIAISINHVKHKLIKKEFYLLVELKKARDALWSEMELAKRIQTALLPDREKIKGFEIAATMVPAKEVGGDYYDIIETPTGDRWVTIGDVSGHGVDSGLIMMMAQTSILSKVNNSSNCKPSAVLHSVNSILRENISRLGSDHYMTMMAIRFNGSQMTLAGKHQDIIIYRSALNKTEIIPTKGTWLGIDENIGKYLEDISVGIEDGDLILLFTDGITEATDKNGEMYGQLRLEQALNQYADLPIRKLLDKVIEEVKAFQEEQLDDMTLVVIKKRDSNVSHWF
ncbi:MAG: PP2C family protein-serine/threonine phosphatase [Desulfobacteraceae bacterium]|nr:PP2C family protein-serine/threonine phosphatase [Desulfobacteraceae bacterium]